MRLDRVQGAPNEQGLPDDQQTRVDHDQEVPVLDERSLSENRRLLLGRLYIQKGQRGSLLERMRRCVEALEVLRHGFPEPVFVRFGEVIEYSSIFEHVVELHATAVVLRPFAFILCEP